MSYDFDVCAYQQKEPRPSYTDFMTAFVYKEGKLIQQYSPKNPPLVILEGTVEFYCNVKAYESAKEKHLENRRLQYKQFKDDLKLHCGFLPDDPKAEKAFCIAEKFVDHDIQDLVYLFQEIADLIRS